MKHSTLNPLLILAISTSLLIGCNGEKQTVIFPERGAEVFYTYPEASQMDVSTRSPIVIRLSHAVADEGTLADSITLLDADETPVDIDISIAPGSDARSIVLRPTSPLNYGSSYHVEVNGLVSDQGLVAFPGNGFSFTTALSTKGPTSQRTSSADFTVTQMFPDGDALPILDFTSLRFRFSQPIDSNSIRYGETLMLEDGDGALVDAIVLAQGHSLTVDPVADLTAGQSYTLTLTSQLTSEFGQPLQAPFAGVDSLTFSPLASGPTEVMVLNAPASGELSVLTGQPVNLVPVIATLLGDDTQSQQQGDIRTELAFVPNFPVATPLRIARGSLLSGDALDVRVSGVVPAGFDSGDVTVQFISDATGYLLPNPYSDSPNAPRQIRLMMDAAIITGNATANAGFTQNVLHMELIGQAIVENGVLTSDALTVVESEVLGLETAFGVLSFRMQAYADQIAAPPAPQDNDAPFIKSWLPGDLALMQRKGDPIIINFNEPVHPLSLAEHVLVFADDIPVNDFRYRLDGTALVINTDLEFNTNYRIELLDGITDLSGNTLAATTLSFDMPEFIDISPASPFVVTTYPGFPCAIAGGSRDLANNIAGRCDGGHSTDDRMPLPVLAADRSIRVRFSQNMDRDSIVLGQTFLVEELDASGVTVQAVSGQLTVRDREMTFMPDLPWQAGTLYRYVLLSNGSSTSSSCIPSNMVCAANGLPLKTRLLAQTANTAPSLDGGGPNVEVVFRGAPHVASVFTQLRNLPVADVNGNTRRDVGEDNAVTNPEMLKNSTFMQIAGTGGSITAANIGCPVGDSCPEEAYGYVTGALDGELIGFVAAEDIPAIARGTVPTAVLDAGGGILVYLYPNIMMASESTVYANVNPLLVGVSADPSPTGPLIMRMRHQCDARTSATPPAAPNADPLPQCTDGHHGLVEGWIIGGESNPEFLSTLDLYLDAPALDPIIRILGVPSSATHNLRSYGLKDVSVRGPVSFIDDGRMQISQLNTEHIDAVITIGAIGGFAESTITLRIPVGGINLNYISAPVKH